MAPSKRDVPRQEWGGREESSGICNLRHAHTGHTSAVSASVPQVGCAVRVIGDEPSALSVEGSRHDIVVKECLHAEGSRALHG